MSETPSSNGPPAEPIEPAESTEPVQPDHPDTIAALKDIDARVDLNERGRIWRIFFYERNRDEDLAHIHGLEDLQQVWLLGSKVTPEGASRLKERLPNVTVYY